MKAKIIKVQKFEYNGNLYDSEDEAIASSKKDIFDKIQETVNTLRQKPQVTELLKYLANISNDELKLLRIFMNKDLK